MDSSSLWRLNHVAVLLFLGFILEDIVWCGKEESPGVEFKSCPASCYNNKLVAQEAFWKGLSAHVRIAFSQCCSLLDCKTVRSQQAGPRDWNEWPAPLYVQLMTG